MPPPPPPEPSPLPPPSILTPFLFNDAVNPPCNPGETLEWGGLLDNTYLGQCTDKGCFNCVFESSSYNDQ
jgi:hypothetical protein